MTTPENGPENGPESAPELGPGEKVCPFCAEVIKAAAIKCRYCGSDLPVDEPTDDLVDEPADDLADTTVEPVAGLDEAAVDPVDPEEPDEPDEADAAVGGELVAEPDAERDLESDLEPGLEPDAGPEEEPGVEPAAGGARTGVDRVLAGLVALCLLLAGGLVAIVVSSLPGDPAVAENGQVTSPSYRDAALSAASANATTVLSYGYEHLDADLAATRKVVLPAYAKSDYEAPMAKLRPGILKSKLTQTAKVLSVSLTSLTKNRATLLLLTNITVVSGDKKSAAPQSLYRVQMTMERKDGDWFVSNMSAL